MTKHYDYHSSEECHSEEESHYEYDYKHDSCGYKKPSKCPPNVTGTWNVSQLQVVDGGSINSPTSINYTVTVTQNGRFITFSVDSTVWLGVWQYNPISGWTIYIVKNNTDNTVLVVTPLKLKKHTVVRMDGIAYEAGTNPSVPRQIAGVGYSSWTRISYC